MSNAPPLLSGVRTLQHPGPTAPLRVNSRQGARSRHFRLRLTPGLSLFDALVQPLAAVGVAHASMVLLDGHFARLDYCVGQVDPTGNALFNYAAPRQAGRTHLLSGCATLGKNEAGESAVHCHAALCAESGEVRGGHIVPQASIVGLAPATVRVTAFEGFGLHVTFDAETNISLFQPHTMTPSDPAPTLPPTATLESGTLGRVAYARVAPNEDLVQRVEDFCAAQGFRHAFVRGALGSLVDACLLTADGSHRHIAGPALEVVSLNGEVRPGADGTARASLCAVVADMQGQLSGGTLVRGGNRVCMTFEITLEEWLPTLAL